MAQSVPATASAKGAPSGKRVGKSSPMLRFILKRVGMFVPTVFIMSLVIFFIIQLPPGDYLTSYVAGLKAEGVMVDASVLANLEKQFGLNDPWYIQYFKWIWNIITRFDFGYSFDLGKRV